MGSAVSGFSGVVATVFLLAENRLLREALLRILSKKDDIHVVGAGSYGPDIFEQIVSTQANVVVLDTISPVLAECGVVHELHQLNPGIRVVMVGMEPEEAVFLRVVQAGAVGYVLKDASAVEVAPTIRAVAAGEASAGIKHLRSFNASRNAGFVAAVSDLALIMLAPLDEFFAHQGINPQRTSDNSRCGSLGFCRMIGTGCVGATLYRGAQSSSPVLAKYSSTSCFLRVSR
jgi:DNA-binding NarL/FixJ family response regulator